MRAVLVVFLLLIQSVSFAADKCSPWPAGQRTFAKQRQTKDTKINFIVRITTDCGSCTGFVIANDTFITAAHCFEDPTDHIFANFVDGRKSELELLVKGEPASGTDVAVLKGASYGVPVVEFDPNPPAKPPFRAISFGYGMEHTQKAIRAFGGVNRTSDDLDIYMGAVDFGDSGGPVFNEKGYLVGEQIAIAIDDKPVFFAVPAHTLRRFLDKAFRKWKP